MFSFCLYVRETNYKNLCLYKFIKSQSNPIGKEIFSTNGAGIMDVYKKKRRKKNPSPYFTPCIKINLEP